MRTANRLPNAAPIPSRLYDMAAAAKRIPDTFIDELLTRADIVEVVERRLLLKKAGREYQALCPFHDEKTPSFTVSPQKQFYHCFGCGAHGTAIGFLMQYEGMDFPAAVEELAATVGLQVPREFSREPDVHTGLYDVLDEAARFYQKQLRGAPKAIDYLKQRGLAGETARTFGLGYAPAEWGALAEALGASRDRLKLLKEAGLIKEGRHGPFDLLRDRIVFPIRDRRGRVIGFGGRLLDGKGPKYLNSPETPLFHKGRELYGLHEACRRGRPEALHVAEGYMDVLALHQAGIQGPVATLGTATTTQHVQALFRASETVIFCYDADRAGRQAAWRALEATLPAMADGREARFLFLPEGDDPDSFIRREGAEAFQQLSERATPLAEFLFERLRAEADPGTLDGRARLVSLARPLLMRLPEGALRRLAFERLAELAKTSVAAVMASRSAEAEKPSQRRAGRPRAVRRTPVRVAVSLLLQRPELARLADPNKLRLLDLPGVPLLVELVELLREKPHLNTAAVVEHFRNRDAHEHLAALAGWTLSVPDEGLEREFSEKLALIEREGLDQRISALQAKQDETGLTEEEWQTLRELIRRKAEGFCSA